MCQIAAAHIEAATTSKMESATSVSYGFSSRVFAENEDKGCSLEEGEGKANVWEVV